MDIPAPVSSLEEEDDRGLAMDMVKVLVIS
jgi:hypothetical protein